MMLDHECSLGEVNADRLRDLAFAISDLEGEFTPFLCVCNYSDLRQHLIESLESISEVPIRRISIEPTQTSLYSTLKHTLGEQLPPAVMVEGLDQVIDQSSLLQSVNQARELFAAHLPLPIIFWITDPILVEMTRKITDFTSWSSVYSFTYSPEQLQALLRRGIDHLFQVVADSERFIVGTAIFDQDRLSELEQAFLELEREDIPLSADLRAGLAFARGRINFAREQDEEALRHYADALQIDQEESALSEIQRGLIHIHRGWCFARLAQVDSNQELWDQARRGFQQGLDLFSSAHSTALGARLSLSSHGGKSGKELATGTPIHKSRTIFVARSLT